MARCPSSSRVGPRNEAIDLMGVVHDVMESQQQQMALMRDGLIVVQQTTTVAIERTAAPREPKLGMFRTSGGYNQQPLLGLKSHWMQSNG